MSGLVKRWWKGLTFRRMRKERRQTAAVARAMALLGEFPRHPQAPRHPLPNRLVVSLTSYPARFATLHLTIKSLLDQTMTPDEIILWIAHADRPLLPSEVEGLQDQKFQVRTCDDLRNFKKIVPALRSYPDAFILIADDDTYYPDNWLERIVRAYDPSKPSIVCHRAHRVRMETGAVAPYRDWQRNVRGPATEVPRADLMPTGNGGVLYPPGSLPPETTDLGLIEKLCATCDDVWLYFMWRRNGWLARRVPGSPLSFVEWPRSQEESLTRYHLGGRKDEHIRDMVGHYGSPL